MSKERWLVCSGSLYFTWRTSPGHCFDWVPERAMASPMSGPDARSIASGYWGGGVVPA